MYMQHIPYFLLIYTTTVVCQYYHYYNLTNDFLEATNLYHDPASRDIVKSLEAAGRRWISKVGNTEYPGRFRDSCSVGCLIM